MAVSRGIMKFSPNHLFPKSLNCIFIRNFAAWRGFAGRCGGSSVCPTVLKLHADIHPQHCQLSMRRVLRLLALVVWITSLSWNRCWSTAVNLNYCFFPPIFKLLTQQIYSQKIVLIDQLLFVFMVLQSLPLIIKPVGTQMSVVVGLLFFFCRIK